jgi:hypothetical protein
MNWLNIVNVIASAILALSTGAFLIFLFGRENSLMHKLGVKNALSVKVGLSLCASGALYNVITLSNPPASEVLVNFGFAFLFCWAAVFHYNRFVKPLVVKSAKRAVAKQSKRRNK